MSKLLRCGNAWCKVRGHKRCDAGWGRVEHDQYNLEFKGLVPISRQSANICGEIDVEVETYAKSYNSGFRKRASYFCIGFAVPRRLADILNAPLNRDSRKWLAEKAVIKGGNLAVERRDEKTNVYRLSTMPWVKFTAQLIAATGWIEIPCSWVFAPDRLTMRDLLKTRNATRRMILLSRIDKATLLEKARRLDGGKDSTLYGFDFLPQVKLLHVKWETKDGEKLENILFVPGEIRFAEEARRWTMGILRSDDIRAES